MTVPQIAVALQVLLGASLISLALFDVFQTVVVPRWTSRRWRMAPFLINGLWLLWLKVARRSRNADRRDDWLGDFAPLCVLTILMVWVGMLILGHGLLIHALRDQVEPRPTTLIGCCYIAGTTLLTIGYGDFVPASGLMRFVFLSAGAIGLATFALVISWLFTLYQAFDRRETLVVMLESRAGSPPSGVMLLQTYATLDMIGELHPTFGLWEQWTADVLDSHLAFPLLPYFRSSHYNQSWISAMGAVLDAATLMISTVQSVQSDDNEEEQLALGSAHMMYRLGCRTVADFSKYFRPELPNKTRAPEQRRQNQGHPGIEMHEWQAARKALENSGYNLKPSEESWHDFSEKRAVYAWQLTNLARLFAAPPTQWLSDHTTPPHLQPHQYVKEDQNHQG